VAMYFRVLTLLIRSGHFRWHFEHTTCNASYVREKLKPLFANIKRISHVNPDFSPHARVNKVLKRLFALLRYDNWHFLVNLKKKTSIVKTLNNVQSKDQI